MNFDQPKETDSTPFAERTQIANQDAECSVLAAAPQIAR
jgi:hypothetical protein